MGKIFRLMGKSSSGKDTIFRKLLQQENLQLKPIILYTTRPIRKNEKQGREYHFTNLKNVTEENFGFASEFTSCGPGLIAAILQ
jgi:guanylate kinase